MSFRSLVLCRPFCLSGRVFFSFLMTLQSVGGRPTIAAAAVSLVASADRSGGGDAELSRSSRSSSFLIRRSRACAPAWPCPSPPRAPLFRRAGGGRPLPSSSSSGGLLAEKRHMASNKDDDE